MTSKLTSVVRSGQRTPKSSPSLEAPAINRPVRSRPLLIDTGQEGTGRYEPLPPFRSGDEGLASTGRQTTTHEDQDVRGSISKTGKSQTPRSNSSGLLKKTHVTSQSMSTSSTPVNVSGKASHLRNSHHTSLTDLNKPAVSKTGTVTPRTGSKPGTQRAVYNSLTQKKTVQLPTREPMLSSPRGVGGPPLIGSPTNRQGAGPTLFKSPSSGTIRGQANSTQSSKVLGSYVTQVQQGTVSSAKMNLTPEQIKERSDKIYREHLFQTFQALKFVRTLPPVDPGQLRAKRLFLDKRRGFANKKTIVFDLDETLVHCCETATQGGPDVVLPITFPTGEVINAGINIRPYAKECLVEANKLFEVIVFTASHQCYADVVLNFLDPSGELVHHRLYRDNCVTVEGLFLKDLRVLGNRRLQDLVIVDNAAYSFSYQLDNGIPIISWHDDPYDRELYNLIDYMKILADAEDIRVVNRDTFHLNTFYEDYIDEFLNAEDKKPKERQTPRKM